MMVIKSLLLIGLMLASALADVSVPKPSMATLQVQSNFDFSLTRKEFRVYYSGLGEGFTTSAERATIRIYKKGSSQEVHSFEADKNEKKIYQLALENLQDQDHEYEVEVCAGQICSDRNPALTNITPLNEMKITCKRVDYKGGKLVASEAKWEVDFFGPVENDLIDPTAFGDIETTVNQALERAGKTGDYLTDYTKFSMSANPQYKHTGKIFYTAVNYDIKRFLKLFDKMPARGATDNTEYADEFCERKYLLSAHAHIVDKTTKEVKHRFKTTLFLSEGGKQLYVLKNEDNKKVHVEMTHHGKEIEEGTYDLWITFCATEKDAIESTFCANPLIKKNFEVTHEQ